MNNELPKTKIDENTLQREVKPLLEIKDIYPKFIIARTKSNFFSDRILKFYCFFY